MEGCLPFAFCDAGYRKRRTGETKILDQWDKEYKKLTFKIVFQNRKLEVQQFQYVMNNVKQLRRAQTDPEVTLDHCTLVNISATTTDVVVLVVDC